MSDSTLDTVDTSSNPNPIEQVTAHPGLSFINKETGGYQPLYALVNGMVNNPMVPAAQRPSKELAMAYVRASQRELVESFGCIGPQVEEGVDFLFTFSLSSTFNSWNNSDDGSSGISAKAKLDLAKTAGARLVLIGLLETHSDAKKKGRLTIGYNNG